MTVPSWFSKWRSALDARKESALYRVLRPIEICESGYVRVNGRRCLDLSSNDYLGFARMPAPSYSGPAGAGSSRLIAGDLAGHRRLEERLAKLKKTESALLFPSGYQANVGLISTLAGRDCAIVADRLIHASLIDGARLSGARLLRYDHGDVADARRMLQETKGKRCLLVTDAVFSMDGDIAPLADLYELALQFDALLVVDEAHATGVLGPGGAGAWHAAGLPSGPGAPVVLMGTLSKALGSQGGFICGPTLLTETLVNSCRAFIYSTGLSPPAVAAAQAALERLEREPQLLERLRGNAGLFRRVLQDNGVNTGPSETPIVPAIIGDTRTASALSPRLEELGILGVAIRPPTVPEGTARLRFTVTAVHDPEDLRAAAETIAGLLATK